jgi:hypothetical protein
MYGAIYRQAYRERPKSTRWSEAGLVGDDTENLDLDLRNIIKAAHQETTGTSVANSHEDRLLATAHICNASVA